MSPMHIPIRLPAIDVLLIRQGMAILLASRLRVDPSRVNLLRIYPAAKPGEFDPDAEHILADLLRKLNALTGKRRRLQLTAIKLAACILAVRIGATYMRHGHADPVRRNQLGLVGQVLRRLEKYRKRAKRKHICRRGSADYAAVARRWRNMVRWIRVHLLCRCGARPASYPQRLLRTIVAECHRHALAGLADAGRTVPDSLVRKYVRLALRYGRRGRIAFGPASLARRDDYARSYLAEFILARVDGKEATDGRR